MFNKFKTQSSSKIDNVETGDLDLVADLEPLEDSVVSQKPTIISEGAIFDGNIKVAGALHLEGKFKGNIKAAKVTIAKGGNFNGKLEADILNIFGEAKGEISCSNLTLNNTSDVSGKLVYEKIVVDTGASISGELIHKV